MRSLGTFIIYLVSLFSLFGQQAPFLPTADSLDFRVDKTITSLELVGDKLFIGGDFNRSFRVSSKWVRTDSLGHKNIALPPFLGIWNLYPDEHGGLYIMGVKTGEKTFNQGEIDSKFYYLDSLGNLKPLLTDFYHKNLSLLNVYRDTLWFTANEHVVTKKSAGLAFFDVQTKQVKSIDPDFQTSNYTKAFNIYDGNILLYDAKALKINGIEHKAFAQLDTSGNVSSFPDSLTSQISDVFQINDSLFGVQRRFEFYGDTQELHILNVRTKSYLNFKFKSIGNIRFAAIYKDSIIIGGNMQVPPNYPKVPLSISPLNEVKFTPIYPSLPVGVYQALLVEDRLYVAGQYDSLFPYTGYGLVGYDLLTRKIVDTVALFGKVYNLLNSGDTLFLGGSMAIKDSTSLRRFLAYSISQKKVIHHFTGYSSNLLPITSLQLGGNKLLASGDFNDTVSFDYYSSLSLFSSDSFTYLPLRNSLGKAEIMIPEYTALNLLHSSGRFIVFSNIYSKPLKTSLLLAYIPTQNKFIQFPGLEGSITSIEFQESDIFIGGSNLSFGSLGNLGAYIHMDKGTKAPTHSSLLIDGTINRIRLIDEDEALVFGNLNEVFGESHQKFSYVDLISRTNYPLQGLPNDIRDGVKMNHHLVFTGAFEVKPNTKLPLVHKNLTICDTLGNLLERNYSVPDGGSTKVSLSDQGAYVFNYSKWKYDSIESSVSRITVDLWMDTLQMQQIHGTVNAIFPLGSNLFMLGQEIQTDINFIPNFQIIDLKKRQSLKLDFKLDASVRHMHSNGDSLLVLGHFQSSLFANNSSAFILQPSTLLLVDTFPLTGLFNHGIMDNDLVFIERDVNHIPGFPNNSSSLWRYSLSQKKLDSLDRTFFANYYPTTKFLAQSDSLIFGTSERNTVPQPIQYFIYSVNKFTWQVKDSFEYEQKVLAELPLFLRGDSLFVVPRQIVVNSEKILDPFILDKKLNLIDFPEKLNMFRSHFGAPYNQSYWISIAEMNDANPISDPRIGRVDNSHEVVISDLSVNTLVNMKTRGDYILGRGQVSFTPGSAIYLVYLKNTAINFLGNSDSMNSCDSDSITLQLDQNGIAFDTDNSFTVFVSDSNGIVLQSQEVSPNNQGQIRFRLKTNIKSAEWLQVKLISSWPKSQSNALTLHVKPVHASQPYFSALQFCPGSNELNFHFSDSAKVDSVQWMMNGQIFSQFSGKYTLPQIGNFPVETRVYSDGCSMNHYATLENKANPDLGMRVQEKSYFCSPNARIQFEDTAGWPLDYAWYNPNNSQFIPFSLQDTFSLPAGWQQRIIRGTLNNACSALDTVLFQIHSTQNFAINNLTADTQCYLGNEFQYIVENSQPLPTRFVWYRPQSTVSMADTFVFSLAQAGQGSINLLTQDINHCWDTTSSLFYIHPKLATVSMLSPGFAYHASIDTLEIQPDIYPTYAWVSVTDSILQQWDNKALIKWTNPSGNRSYLSLTGRDSLGCSTDSSFFAIDIFTTGLFEETSPSCFIYPNPVKSGEQLKLVCQDQDGASLRVWDNLGKEISISYQIQNGVFILSTSGMMPGIYHAIVYGETETYRMRFVLED